jgi:hypothetical protein
LAGVKDLVPDNVEGGSLVGALLSKGKASVERKNPFMVFHFPNYVLGKGKDAFPQSAIMSGDMKLMKLYDWDRPKLFDLSKDIGEQNDIWDKLPKMAEQKHLTLQEYLKAVNAPMPKYNPDWDMTVQEWDVWNKAEKSKNASPKKAGKKSEKKALKSK